MPTNWVVSGHAAAYATKQPHFLGAKPPETFEMLPVPPGVKFIFFNREGTGLYGGWDAYKRLMKSPPDFDGLAKLPGYEEFKGVSVLNYVLYGDKDWWDDHNLSAAGIFVAGDTNHKDSRTCYLTGHTYSLKDFLRDRVKSGDTIYWICCRVWRTSTDQSISRPPQTPPPPPPGKPSATSGVPTSILGNASGVRLHSSPFAKTN